MKTRAILLISTVCAALTAVGCNPGSPEGYEEGSANCSWTLIWEHNDLINRMKEARTIKEVSTLQDDVESFAQRFKGVECDAVTREKTPDLAANEVFTLNVDQRTQQWRQVLAGAKSAYDAQMAPIRAELASHISQVPLATLKSRVSIQVRDGSDLNAMAGVRTGRVFLQGGRSVAELDIDPNADFCAVQIKYQPEGYVSGNTFKLKIEIKEDHLAGIPVVSQAMEARIGLFCSYQGGKPMMRTVGDLQTVLGDAFSVSLVAE